MATRWVAVRPVTRAVTTRYALRGTPPTLWPVEGYHEVTPVGNEVVWMRGMERHLYISLGRVRKLTSN